jgi:hypothetical protein
VLTRIYGAGWIALYFVGAMISYGAVHGFPPLVGASGLTTMLALGWCWTFGTYCGVYTVRNWWGMRKAAELIRRAKS